MQHLQQRESCKLFLLPTPGGFVTQGIIFPYAEMTAGNFSFLGCDRLCVPSPSTLPLEQGAREADETLQWGAVFQPAQCSTEPSQLKLQHPHWGHCIAQEAFFDNTSDKQRGGWEEMQMLSCDHGTAYNKNPSALCRLLNLQLFVKLRRTSSLSMQWYLSLSLEKSWNTNLFLTYWNSIYSLAQSHSWGSIKC